MKHKLFLVCTGLGKVKRGFESYILDLTALLQAHAPEIHFEVLLGKRVHHASFQQHVIPHIHRNHSIWRWLGIREATAFAREQDFFFLGMIPFILKNKQAVYYLGEYRLYCHLFRFRKWFGLKYRLCLHTGGQVSPGLFDDRFDFVHHITPVYYATALETGIPQHRQFILPHVVDHDFEQDPAIMTAIKKKAGHKKIILSVGSVDKQVKRMHLLARLFEGMQDDFFIIICGSPTKETAQVSDELKKVFGEDGFLIEQVQRKNLGSYYAVSNAFVLCSPKESFGMVLVEAMYHGLPILVHDFEEARYVCGEQAIYFNIDDPKNAQQWIRTNWYKQDIILNEASIEFAHRNYSDKSISTKYVQMFQKFIA